MKNKLIIIILSIIGFLMLVILIGKINLNIKFSRQVKTSFANSQNISNQKFEHKQLESLPQPVLHYFKHVLKNVQTFISYKEGGRTFFHVQEITYE